MQGMNYVYVLENGKGKHYIGSCEDLSVRLRQHNQNSVRSTKNRGPFIIVYREEFTTKTEARKRENKLKGYKGNSVFKRIIQSPSSSRFPR